MPSGRAEEATVRGVVLRTLLPADHPRGTSLVRPVPRDVCDSLVRGGVGGVELCRRPRRCHRRRLGPDVVGIGVGFAAVVVVTGAIWPPVVIHAVLYFASALQFGADDSAARGSALGRRPGIGALTATFGIWLLPPPAPARRPLG